MDEKGICWGFGWNGYSQLGQGDIANVVPTKLDISIKEEIDNMYCGPWHSALLTTTNEVYTFGYNGHNECSIRDNNEEIDFPYHLTRDEIGIDKDCRIESVITGYQSTLIVVAD